MITDSPFDLKGVLIKGNKLFQLWGIRLSIKLRNLPDGSSICFACNHIHKFIFIYYQKLNQLFIDANGYSDTRKLRRNGDRDSQYILLLFIT